MEFLRDWGGDEAMAAAAREMRTESPVWAKLLVEHSPAAGRADPLGLIRYAFGDAVDANWGGRMVDLMTYGKGGLHHSARLSCSMLVGPSLRAQLRIPASGGKAALPTALRECASRAVGPDLFVVIGTPESQVPTTLPKGAIGSQFFVGTLGGEPSTELQLLASESGGTAMALREEADGRFLGAMFCAAFMTLARSGAGRVVDPAVAVQHYDADSSFSGGRYTSPSGVGYGTRSGYAVGEYGAPHGFDRLGQERPNEHGSGYWYD